MFLRTCSRAGDDLHYQMEITLEEALLGYKKSIRHLDNHQVSISHDAVTKPFQVRLIEGEGMPHHNFPSQHGDLHVLHNIKFPASLSAEQKKIISDILPQ
jgi:DnaJ-class molecular chaperone